MREERQTDASISWIPSALRSDNLVNHVIQVIVHSANYWTIYMCVVPLIELQLHIEANTALYPAHRATS
jgi:hypothetical protein